jgi:hypothetical protein
MCDRKIVDRALERSTQGFGDRNTAEICGDSVRALRKWRARTRRVEGRAGRIKRGCPRCHGRQLDQPAYAHLLGLYLGDGHIVATSKRCYRLAISRSAEWSGLIEEAVQTMGAVMPLSKVHCRNRPGSVDVSSQSMHWPCLFPQHGPGMKHTRKIELVPWQQEIVDEFTKEFVRGLIHSDGCRSMNRVRRPGKDGDRWYAYPRYTFSNASDDIRGIFTDALDRLGIDWRRMNARNISVARREAVARLDEFVGPKH